MPPSRENIAEALRLHREGVIALQGGHERKGVALLEEAARLHASAGLLVDLGTGYRRTGRGEEAVRCYRRALELEPQQADALNNLGNALREAGKLAEAEECYRDALRLRPQFAMAARNLGNVLDAQEKPEEAERALREASALAPDDAEAHNDLGNVLQKLERNAEAEASYRRALQLKPAFADAHANLCAALRHMGRPGEAERHVREALALRPQDAGLHYALGIVQEDLGQLSEAEGSYRRAAALQPGHADAHNNLGSLLLRVGRWSEAEAAMRRSLALKPDFAAAHSNLIFALDLVEGAGLADQQAERRRWYEQHGRKDAAARPSFANPRDPERKLRIGYVSADFRSHSACYVFAPVICGHDRSRFEVVCYSGVRREDEMTARLRGAADAWRTVTRLSDEALAAQIRGDGIDILVDLSGHSAGNRLPVFARKPAPVQVTAWGHATGSGLETMDYLFADPVLVPVAERALFAEELIDLPCALCYEPPPYLPQVEGLPALKNGVVTFGCVNRLEKITDAAIVLWGQILRATPTARLLVKDKGLVDAALRERFLRRLREIGGIEAGRVTLHGASPHAEHLKIYGQIDVGLDPFPQGGGVSTTEALWMGVPVVTLAGATPPSRISASFLTALGMPEWIAREKADYARIAVEAARDLPRLAALRRELRARASASAFGNLPGYVRAVEQAYRSMWQRWCKG